MQLHMRTIDLRDAFHTLRLAKTSQKYFGIMPYYGSPTYHYLPVGIEMSTVHRFGNNLLTWYFKMILLKESKILTS